MLWWRARPDSAAEADGAGSVRKIISLTRSLMSDRGDVAGGPLAADILGLFKTLDQPGRRAFFDLLVKDFPRSRTTWAARRTLIVSILLRRTCAICRKSSNRLGRNCSAA